MIFVKNKKIFLESASVIFVKKKIFLFDHDQKIKIKIIRKKNKEGFEMRKRFLKKEEQKNQQRQKQQKDLHFVFVTGFQGSGKTTLVKELVEQGIEAFDFDDVSQDLVCDSFDDSWSPKLFMFFLRMKILPDLMYQIQEQLSIPHDPYSYCDQSDFNYSISLIRQLMDQTLDKKKKHIRQKNSEPQQQNTKKKKFIERKLKGDVHDIFTLCGLFEYINHNMYLILYDIIQQQIRRSFGDYYRNIYFYNYFLDLDREKCIQRIVSREKEECKKLNKKYRPYEEEDFNDWRDEWDEVEDNINYLGIKKINFQALQKEILSLRDRCRSVLLK